MPASEGKCMQQAFPCADITDVVAQKLRSRGSHPGQHRSWPLGRARHSKGRPGARRPEDEAIS
jgi:hypothetical protein